MSSEDEDKEDTGGAGLPSLADIARLLGKRKLIIGFCTALCGLSSLGLLSLLTPQFQASATVFIDPRDKNVSEMKQVTSDLIANTPAIESETEIIHSSSVAGRVIDDLRLSEDTELTKPDGIAVKIKAMLKPWIAKPEPAHAQSLSELIEATAVSKPGADSTVEAFLGRVSAERVRETFLIQIGFKSRDPVKAARIANAIADAYVHTQVETKMHAAEQATVWIDRQINDLRDKVFTAEKSVADFKSANQLFDSESFQLDEREVARQMEQLTLARNNTAATRAKFEQAKQLLDSQSDIGTLGDVLRSTAIVALKEQYTDSLRQQAAAASKYGPLHPNMLKANAQAASSTAQLRAEIERIVTNFKSEAETASHSQTELEANLAKSKIAMSSNIGQTVRLRELQREATAAREVYEGFLKRGQETKQQQDMQAPDARIVNRAITPTIPVSPKKTMIVLGGFGGGLGLGLILAVLTEFLFPSFVRTTEIEKSFKLRHMTTIARMDEHDPAMGVTLPQLRHILVQPHTVFSESIRAIRVGIERLRKDRQPQIVLVTSAVPFEGKSVIASNLALHYALSGVRTLLIDCDLTGTGLTPRLMPKARTTLYDCVMRRLPVQTAIVREASTGLHFLPGIGEQRGSVTPAELLASPVTQGALKRLNREFEMIVLDGRALLPSVDSRILAEMSHQIVFVHKWGDTPQASARQALRALGHSLTKVTGVVLNQVEEDQLSSDTPLTPTPTPRAPKSAPRREPRLAA